MNETKPDFSELKRLLKLKRHEVPPPGFFNHFSEEVVARIRERFGDSGWMFVPNTLHLETLYCSEDLAAELRNHPRCLVAESPVPLQFREGRITLFDPLSPANAH